MADRASSAVFLPANHHITEILQEEMAALGGEITNTHDRDGLLLLRGVVPHVRFVSRGDGVQGGVAIRVCGEDVLVYPYIFRQICSNGLIVSQSLAGRRISRVQGGDADVEPDAAELARINYCSHETATELGRAIQSCCADEVFSESVTLMRRAALGTAEVSMALLSHLGRLRDLAHGRARVNAAEAIEPAGARGFIEITRRFLSDGDPTHFGLVNAITSVARDTRDPDARWQLEELGGSVLANRPVSPPSLPMRAVSRERSMAVNRV